MALEISVSSAVAPELAVAPEPAVAAVATPEPAAAPVPPDQERPASGTFMFLPIGAPWVNCSQTNDGGDPTGHPILVLPDDAHHPELVQILFTTTKDVKKNCKARSWGENYLPLGDQEHPWREPVALCGSFPKPTSLNVSSRYIVPWRWLEDLTVNGPGVPPPGLSPQVFEQVYEFVKCPHFDKHTPWIRPKASGAPAVPHQKRHGAYGSQNWRRRD